MARRGIKTMDELFDLCLQLKQEKLFVDTEKEHLQKLYEEVRRLTKLLFHAAWIAKQQKLSLEQIISFGSDPKNEDICGRHNEMECINFIDSYKVLLYHDGKYGELLKFLHENPVLLGQCLLLGEKREAKNIKKYVHIVISSIYGNCLLAEDESRVLEMIKVLIDLQLSQDTSPRRLLRKGNCVFSLLFKQFCDSLFSTKLFLTAALHDPIMRLLMEDEWFYDIDPGKALERFPREERKTRFGEPGSDDYQQKLDEYRKFIVNKLVLLSSRFVNVIKGSIHCFPPSLTWLISHVYRGLLKTKQADVSEIRATCADLVFALFICPAICDPEPYGITTDVPISHIARHNLMQMAQIVQVLAVSTWDEIDEKVKDIYSSFEKGCMSNFIDTLVNNFTDDPPSISRTNAFNQSVEQSGILITANQLNDLVQFLRGSLNELDDKMAGYSQLEELLSSIPSQIPKSESSDSKTLTPIQSNSFTTPPDTPNTRKKHSKGLKSKNSSSNLMASASPDKTNDTINHTDTNTNKTIATAEDVLVIQVGILSECPGMLSENKLLSSEQESGKRKVKYQTPELDDGDVGSHGAVEIQEKRTRFSLSHDQESIGNASDYQEVISEAASSHSVDMDQDLEENDNDNLSDMMSANVSGRGSPSISGRDTPLSQAGSVEERNTAEFPVRVPVTVRKQNREDVTDRFGKFEIKTEFERDETKSTVSDTWSTDVLASDSEPPEQNQLERLVEVVEDMSIPNLVSHEDNDNTFPPSELSETTSDAWSTDVLASDTEEKQSEFTDLDQDDLGSTTGRSEVLDDLEIGREETPKTSDGPPSDESLLNLGLLGASYGVQGFSKVGQDLQRNDLVYNLGSLKKMTRGAEMSKQDTRSRNVADSEFKNENDDVFMPIEPQCVRPKEYHGSKKTQMSKSDIALWERRTNEMSTGVNAAFMVNAPSGDVAPGRPINDMPRSSNMLIDLDNTESFTSKDKNGGPSTDGTFDNKRLSAALSLFDQLSMGNDQMDILDNSVNSQDLLTARETAPSFNTTPLVCISKPSQDGDVFDSNIPIASGSDSTLDEKELGAVGGYDTSDLVSAAIKKCDSNDSFSSLPQNDGKINTDPSSDNVSLQSDEKDFEVDNKTDKSSKKGGIFKSLKDKINTTIKKKGNRFESQQSNSSDTSRNMDVTDTQDTKKEESLDEMLDKYRSKKREDVNPATNDESSNQTSNEPFPQPKEKTDTPMYHDCDNLENNFAFQNAKRKLRLVLSIGDFRMLGTPQALHDDPRQENELIGLLRAQLAEAVNLQNKDLVAQLHEVIRCVRLFDHDGIQKLLKSLKDEYKNRSTYISYLVRCRQGLLGSVSHFQRLLNRTQRDKDIGTKHLVNVCTRLFLESYDSKIVQFYNDFQKLKMSDEKTDLVEHFLEYMYHEMEQHPIWNAATDAQLEDGKLSLERSILSRIYTHALFPNGDGDISRDQVFRNHIKKLSQVIKPTHRDLCIPRIYHFECPWPAAQREIFMINAYKTPKDKLGCVLRCSTTIMNLLSMANEKSVPAADDFIPVLIYVIIRANPPCLLSTLQYVTSFYDNRLAGEECYWWSQFSSAVEFIKTMDYRE